MEFYYYLIIGFVVFFFVFDKIIDYLNTTKWSEKLPVEAKGIYDEEKYKKSQAYEKTKYVFSKYTSIFSFVITLLVLIFGGFGYLDNFVRGYTENEIYMALIFFGIISLINTIVNLPFSYYGTFVIEEKFGFNKSTKKIFFFDILKSLLISSIIGGLLMSLIVWIYSIFGTSFWIYAWGIMTFVSVFFMMFYSSLIVPLFNKQTPLEEGKLRTAIQEFATKVGFKLDNIFVIDGSKRSTKANAYFSGFGPKKRIVLYDTLINDLEIDELVGVLAHEIGHYKRKHTLQMLAFGIFQTGLMLFLFAQVLGSNEISQALGANETSFHIGAIAFGILFTPISMILGLFGNILSRKNEYEADEYAAKNFNPGSLIGALKKLSVNNLSNLTPHPAYEFFHYSHPGVLKRIKTLNSYK